MELRDYQKECVDLIDKAEPGSYLVVCATGLGKCFSKGTKIMMYDGTIQNVENLKQGDLIMGWDSTPRRIKSLARGSEMMYEVKRKKHESYTVNESHILSLKITGLGKRTVKDCFGNVYRAGDICNIEVRDYLRCSKIFKHVAKGYCVPVDFENSSVPVDSYFLGVWLGDGSSRGLQITTPDEEIKNYLYTFSSTNDMQCREDNYQNSGAAKTYSITCKYKHDHPVRKYFKDHLFMNKHIPSEYLINSREIRLELLAGLIDTDGYLITNGDRIPCNYEFCTQHESLQKQVSFLCRSLGFTAIEHRKYNKKYQKYYYYIIISGNINEIPVKVERKKAKQKNPNKSNLMHGIKVDPVGVGEYFGFELDGTDRMFLLWDCTVAHNTVIFTNIKRKGRMLILSHREELVKQPLKYFDCSTGVEMASESSNGEDVVSASVQSIVRRLDRFKPDDFDMIIVDEAHHAAADTYKKILNYFNPRLVIGFTATPNRADGARLNDVFQKIIFKRDLKWGIKSGYLCNIDCKRIDIGYDLSEVHTRMGDYAPGELADAMEGTEDAIADAYNKLAKGATLIFSCNVAHAESIASRIDGAVAVTGCTKNRADIINAFTRREIPCLVNCMVFTEGTDMPLVETVMIARPTQSDSLYTQMVGRGLRLHPEKDKLLLIDCVGITGKRSLCTAPSLLGIDISEIPKSMKKELEGDLFELPEKAVRLSDNPVSWVRNVETVNLWAEENSFDTHGINLFRMPDGSMKCQLPGKIQYVIPCPDELGYVMLNGKEWEMQRALDALYVKLKKDHSDCEMIWNLEKSKYWASKPATEKQIELIQKRFKKLRYDFEDMDIENLSRFQASQILNRVMR